MASHRYLKTLAISCVAPEGICGLSPVIIERSGTLASGPREAARSVVYNSWGLSNRNGCVPSLPLLFLVGVLESPFCLEVYR